MAGMMAVASQTRGEPNVGSTFNVSWPDAAACRDASVDPELFFPVTESGPVARRQILAAKTVCARCAVADQCRDWALRNGEPDGIWGGMTTIERRRARRSRRPGTVEVA
jgi:WhiB family redox-sensing transcriptional regulator